VLENLNRTEKPGKTVNDDLNGKTAKEGASKKFCVAETLETNEKNLNMKSVDMDFDVDPLFHKMSQTFDEGGAKGMLLNHLCMYDGCDIAFDSSERVFGISGREEAVVDAAAPPMEETIDTFAFAPKLEKLQKSIQKMEMCPPLERLYSDRREQRISSGFAAAAAESNDGDDDDYADDGDGIEFSEALDLDNLDAGGTDMGEDAQDAWQEEQKLQQALEGDEDFASEIGSSSTSSSDTVQHQPMPEDAMMSGAYLEEASEFSFWNPKLMKGWAGNSHWKFAKPKIQGSTSKGAEGAAAEKKAPKTKKVAFIIGFTEGAVEEAEFAAPPRSATSLELSKAVVTKSINAAAGLLLPVDLHYNVSCLTQLFSKPHIYLKTRPGRNGGEASNTTVEGDFVVATNERMLDNDFGDDCDDGDDGDDGFSYGMEDAVGSFGMAQAAHKVEKIDVKYETVAKKVDVKRLKSSLWSYLDEKEVGMKKEEEQDPEDKAQEEPKEVSCSQTIADLSTHVPANVTVPFYFICLLHLANEKGLELTGAEDLSDFTIRDDAAAGEAC
jgi:condensin complex subunit 2